MASSSAELLICSFHSQYMSSTLCSGAMVADKTRALQESGAHQVLSADCGCLMNINGALEKQHAALRGQHLASFLWQRTGGGR